VEGEPKLAYICCRAADGSGCTGDGFKSCIGIDRAFARDSK
jgi:hypothetical protein